MFARIVALVAVLPLLSPPGMCICRWLGAARAASATANAATPDGTPTPAPPGGCCCCPVPEGPTADDPDPDAPQPKPKPLPQHCPHCLDWELSALTKAEAPPLLDSCLAGPSVLWLILPDLVAASAPERATDFPTAPPLYLLCCDLRC